MILVQPNGKLAIWSSIVDAIVVYDATDEEILEYEAERAAELARSSTRRAIERVRAGLVPRNLHLTWEEALQQHVERHGPFEGGQE
ncbi:hypothetical protein [Kineococcus radiotolerans]|uniref:Uncharacterized protein n=1 Tax=Kineococcus radiotolerans (strain ATCC BAA-149 / DSM 14245 / SRS30216) TaxID=266940 RepID=A6W8N6_KINRD|nr:hypothetical protein [Kineococcus radiotolerans]ABS03175.1 hypothetical protein Krad_1689 [Kineococcus radiotolerans SRS30216 = ATCC BAA-149]